MAEPLISRFLEGYNVTILAYGQTSSGKSYTMGTSAGDDVDYEGLVSGSSVDPHMGIIPRAVAQIFSGIKQNQGRSGAIQYSAKASFIEIYNEDLIDLLADADGDSRPHVQIREDKGGNIIWTGLREVRVNSVAEVMNYLLQGSSVRRTNETDMNAQSSRSHAIFSLTLTQRKYVGSGPPPGSSLAPSAYGGRTTPTAGSRIPSGRPRPVSSIPTPGSRIVSPSPALGSRPHTPSGIPGLGGRQSSSGLRPVSTIGAGRSASPMFGAAADDQGAKSADGEWVTVTSKFHFVDLAGSERLKRTAAQGERVKEGISINSGLHALGNVISALGDPNKAKRTTHVPYRDSKLTRLLQDSLGGNAHTLMIACVSPTEYNVSETVNTLQYANRARNIKNKAELNEVEVGWDDIDYLQTLVQKLRKELSILKGNLKGNGDLGDTSNDGPLGNTRAAQREILEWQDRYAALSQKHSQLTAEVTKLRAQLDPRKQDEADKDNYFKMAEPIIVEYEKSLDALEGQLNLTKAALAFTEDLANEREAELEDQAKKLQTVEQELETKESSIVELQTKLAKLQEREASSESYTRELEARLQTITVRDDTDAAVVADLRKEISRLKDNERNTEQYIKELESRLASSEESAAALANKISKLEADVEQRDQEYKNLQARFELLDSGKEAKAMADELESREKKVQELEERLATVTREKDEASQKHSSLLEAASDHEKEKESLLDKIKGLEAATAAAAAASAAAGAGVGALAASNLESSREVPNEADEAKKAEAPIDAAQHQALRQQLEALQAEMQAVRDAEAELRSKFEDTNVKYRDSLREIGDLNQQLTEAKLTGTVTSPSSFHQDGGEEELEVLAPPSSENDAPQTPLRTVNTPSRRSSMRRPESLLIDTTNRQSPGDKRLLRRSSGSFLGYNKADGIRTPGVSPHARQRSLSQSLSQELLAGLSPSQSQGRGPRPLSLTGSVPPSPTLRAFEPDTPANLERKVASLEKETMRLQEALRERDEEIQALETSVRQYKSSPGSTTAPTEPSEAGSHKSASLDSPFLQFPSKVDADRLATPDATNSHDDVPLTPASKAEFETIKQLLVEARITDENGNEPGADTIARFDQLMRSMARKETQHRENMEVVNKELVSVRKQHETLQTLSRDQLANMTNEIESLRAQLVEAKSATPEREDGPSTELLALEARHKTALADRQSAHEGDLQSLRDIHAAAISSREADFTKERESLSQQHEEALARKVQELEATAARKAEEHEQALSRLREEHERQLKAQADEHAAALGNAELAKQSSSAESESERETLLKKLQDEHQSMIEKLKQDHEVGLTKALESRDAEHQSVLADHAAKLSSVGAEAAAALEQLKQEHARELERLVKEHGSVLDETRMSSSRSADNLRTELEGQHLSTLTDAVREAEAKAKAESAAALEAAKAEHASQLDELAKKHAAELEAAEAKYTKAITSHATELDNISREHAGSTSQATATIAELETKRDESEKQVNKLRQEMKAAAIAMDVEHRAELEKVVEELQIVLQEKDGIKKAYEDLEQRHSEQLKKLEIDPHEVDTLRSELAETSDALVTLEAALTEAQEERDQLLIEMEMMRQTSGDSSMANGNRASVIVDPTVSRELESHKAALSKVKAEMAKIKGELHAVMEERNKHEQTIKDLQQRVNNSETRSIRSHGSGSFGQTSSVETEAASAAAATAAMLNGARSPSAMKRSSEYDGINGEHLRSQRPSMSLAGKPPPPTPPPNMPPPPTPVGNGNSASLMRSSVGLRSSTSSQITRPESPANGGVTRSSSITSMHSPSINGAHSSDGKLTRLLAEQAEEIKNLAKQLNHCEADLQANIDLVATLEAALNDSERNLRKSRVQLAEVTRERDRYSAQADEMRAQLSSAQHEVESVRNSVMLEKQGYESKIEEERQAKERARKALEARLEEVSRRKNSKLFCL